MPRYCFPMNEPGQDLLPARPGTAPRIHRDMSHRPDGNEFAVPTAGKLCGSFRGDKGIVRARNDDAWESEPHKRHGRERPNDLKPGRLSTHIAWRHQHRRRDLRRRGLDLAAQNPLRPMGDKGAAQAVGHQDDGLPASLHVPVQHRYPGLNFRPLPIHLLDCACIREFPLPTGLPMLRTGSAKPRHHQKTEIIHIPLTRLPGEGSASAFDQARLIGMPSASGATLSRIGIYPKDV